MQQYGSKYFTTRSRPTSRDPGVGSKGQNSTFSEQVHVAYQIKWHHKSSNTVATILPTEHIKRVKRSKFNFFRTWSCCILYKMESRMQQNCSKQCARRSPPPACPTLGCSQKVEFQLVQNMVMLHIKLNGIANAATCKHICCPCTHPRPLKLDQRSNYYFSESSCVACQIRRERSIEHHASTYSVLTYTPQPFDGVKGQNIFFSESSHVLYQIKGNGA